MTVETATYVNQLNSNYPASGDSPQEGDDHVRLIKSVVVATFPNVGGAVTPTHTELNYVDGVTSAIQTQLDAKAALTERGVVLLNAQTASTSAQIDITANLSSTYEEYEWHIINAIPDNGAGAIGWLRTSVDSGVSFSATNGDYDWVLHLATNGVATVTDGSTSANKIVLSDTVRSQVAEGGFCGVIRIFNPAGTTNYKRCNWQASYPGAAGLGKIADCSGSGTRVATAAINGLRFMFSTGNIASGQFKLYGIKK